MLNRTFKWSKFVGNLRSPCPLQGMYISRLCTIQLHVCLTALVLEESILLVTLMHALSLTVISGFCSDASKCRQ